MASDCSLLQRRLADDRKQILLHGAKDWSEGLWTSVVLPHASTLAVPPNAGVQGFCCRVQATRNAAEVAAKKVQEDLEAVIARHEAEVAAWEAATADGNQQLSCRQQHMEVCTPYVVSCVVSSGIGCRCLTVELQYYITQPITAAQAKKCMYITPEQPHLVSYQELPELQRNGLKSNAHSCPRPSTQHSLFTAFWSCCNPICS